MASSTARRSHKFQAPKGTRDFLPAEMAVRRHLESAWRGVATNHGFDEIDGPAFEHLELYTIKSGPGIVNELFTFRRGGGETDYALRPEFTPTLARMYAASARSLPRPTRWFSIAGMFRAERPQRGRLREHFQWNVDVIGDETPRAEAEIIATAVACLRRLGLTPEDVRVKISHRAVLESRLLALGIRADRMLDAFAVVDASDKLEAEAFRQRTLDVGLTADRWDDFAAYLAIDHRATDGLAAEAHDDRLAALHEELRAIDLLEWCDYKPSLARGLAYYTGTVFEIHEAAGRERAIAGGGRYDHLVELFGGPATPAVGLAMGDVVIRLVLEDRGLLEAAASYLPRPDAFVITTREDGHADRARLVADLRREGLHVRCSARATRNLGKLLGEAGSARARFAVILADEFDAGNVVLKDLDAGAQDEVPVAELPALLRTRLASRD